jgi:hypothetical protein
VTANGADPWLTLLATARSYYEQSTSENRRLLGWALEAFPDQPTLFDAVPDYPDLESLGLEEELLGVDENAMGGFRATDPETSREGAAFVYPRTGYARHRLFVQLLPVWPEGLDSHQLVDLTGIRLNNVTSRMSELKNKAKLVDGIKKHIGVCGSPVMVWAVNERGIAEAKARGDWT